jgi:hypothetical protein
MKTKGIVNLTKPLSTCQGERLHEETSKAERSIQQAPRFLGLGGFRPGWRWRPSEWGGGCLMGAPARGAGTLGGPDAPLAPFAGRSSPGLGSVSACIWPFSLINQMADAFSVAWLVS